jgi:hypothetical protein
MAGIDEASESDDPLSVRVAVDFEDTDDESDDNRLDGDFDMMKNRESASEDSELSDIDEDELEGLKDDLQQFGTLGSAAASRSKHNAQEEGLLDLGTFDKITALKKAFPAATTNIIEATLRGHKKDDSLAYEYLNRLYPSATSLAEMIVFRRSLQETGDSETQGEGGEKSNEDAGRIAMIRHFDKHGFAPGSLSNGTALSEMAKAQRLFGEITPLSRIADEGGKVRESIIVEADSETSSESDSESESELNSVSTSSEDDGDDEDDGDFGQHHRLPTNVPLPDSSSETSSSGSSDSDGELTMEPSKAVLSTEDSDEWTSSDDSSDETSDESSNSDSSVGRDSGARLKVHEASTLPGRGHPRTKARNLRRQQAKRAAKSITGPSLVVPVSAQEEDLDERKQALLQALGAPRAEQGSEGVTFIEAPTSTEAASPARRMRLDIGAGRRLLFGALGLRNPKTKDDEETIKARLMQGVRPLVSRRADEAYKDFHGDTGDHTKDASPVLDCHPGDWRDKIAYHAVECCDRGVQLSEPPFPFVQRWDSRGQGKQYEPPKRGNKKRRQQEALLQTKCDYEQEDSCMGLQCDVVEEPDRGRRWKDGNDVEYQTDIVLDYDDEFADGPPAADEEAAMDDLPLLPHNIASLPPLEHGDAKPGMVITWKQLQLSRGTGWQPLMSDMTAIVEQVAADGDSLGVRISRRDLLLEHPEKRFDEDTGKRIYEGFEAPDDEDEDGADDGFRELRFSELAEPKILRQPPPQGVECINGDQGIQSGTNVAGVDDPDSPSKQLAAEAVMASMDPANLNL